MDLIIVTLSFVVDGSEQDKKQEKGSSRKKHRQFSGLAYLSMITTGSPIEKLEQVSNWEKRPLREKQVTYAGKGNLHNLYSFKTNVMNILAL